MSNFTFPFRITRDTPAQAGQVQGNFDALLAWIKANVLQVDDSVRMTAPFTLFGTPSMPQHAATKGYVDAMLPVGVIQEYVGDTPPAGWLWCDGQTYTESEYPALWNVIRRKFTDTGVVNGQFQVPDFRGRASFGPTVADPVGKRTGSEQVKAHTHTTPAHRHTINHGHGASGSSAAETQDHSHGITVNGGGVGFDPVTRMPDYDSTGIPLTDPANRTQMLTGDPIVSTVPGHRHAMNVGIATNYATNPAHAHSAQAGGRNATHTHGIGVTVNNHNGDSGETAPSTNSTGDENLNRPLSLVVGKIIKAV